MSSIESVRIEDARDTMKSAEIPRFEAPRWLSSGHLQTIVGSLAPGVGDWFPSTYHEIPLGDGDRLAVLDSRPDDWEAGSPSVLMVHGLGGSARSKKIKRIAARLWNQGIRVVRMNLRGAGAGFGLAKGIYHAGRTEDLRAVVDWMGTSGGVYPLGLLGFSLGGNLVLKLAAEASESALGGLDCVVAVNPPIDLRACCVWIQRPENRIYDRNFVKHLKTEIDRLHGRFPELGPANLDDVATLYDFDDRYTALRNRFSGATEYYASASAQPLIPKIAVDGLVIHSEDDPFIPVDPFLETAFPPSVTLELVPGGGHLGYISRRSWNGSRRWLDLRVAAWFAQRWNAASRP